MNELKTFIAMLDRAGVGYGTRQDYSPPGESVLVEHPVEGTESDFWVSDWSFDEDGNLIDVAHYKGEVG